tara:strand:- start:129 stop:1097 length:969 start_codon:yes stop_codon:yes gene_type:complete
MEYKYSLDKSSKKYNCPNCNKKSFVRYWNNEIKSYLEEIYGRCDRESKCQYHHRPSTNKPLFNYHKVYQAPIATFHNKSLIVEYGRNFYNNNFIQYLKRYFSLDEIKNVILKYLIGTSNKWDGATVFWQIDNRNNVHAGKIILYNKTTGKRVKKPYSKISWIHKTIHSPDFVLQQCLFGLHLIIENDSKIIAITESEKTAIVMSMLIPEYIWMATGSKSNLKSSLISPVKDYNIILFPDKTEFKEWNSKATEMSNKGYKISCSNLLENTNLDEGADLVDLFLFTISNDKHQTKNLSEKETQIQLLSIKNPVLQILINELDLV